MPQLKIRSKAVKLACIIMVQVLYQTVSIVVQVLYQLGTKKGTSTGILYKHNKQINNNKQETEISDFLKVKKNKNYNEPL